MGKSKRLRAMNSPEYFEAFPVHQSPVRQKAPELVPLTTKQKYYFQLLDTVPIILATGWPGTSKTYVPARRAAHFYKNNKRDHKIVMVRPAVSASESLGFFKGTKEEKMMEWITPILDALKEELTDGEIQQMIKDDSLQMVPLECIKGRSFKNSYIIIDEAEDINPHEAKHLTTRVGDNCTCVICGDISQSDLKFESGLAKLVRMRNNSQRLADSMGHVDFNDYRYYKDGGDIVRSRECAVMVQEFAAEDEREGIEAKRLTNPGSLFPSIEEPRVQPAPYIAPRPSKLKAFFSRT